jgi:asparagine synthase (glutamine-hydrolysing)
LKRLIVDDGWLNHSWFSEQQGVSVGGEGHWDNEDGYFRKDLLAGLFETNLPMLLRFEDRNSMAHSVESRVPFLTTEIIEFILSLPPEYLLDLHGNRKAVFREAMRGIVPGPILARKDKIGFATPEKMWLTSLSPWVEDVFGRARIFPMFDGVDVVRDWRKMMTGNARFDFRFWRMLNFIFWVEEFDVDF